MIVALHPEEDPALHPKKQPSSKRMKDLKKRRIQYGLSFFEKVKIKIYCEEEFSSESTISMNII
jgi:hypothetical protein